MNGAGGAAPAPVPRPPVRPAPPGPAGRFAYPGPEHGEDGRHPAVDAAVQAIVNAAGLSPADQIAQYEAAYRTLRETLATIDQA